MKTRSRFTILSFVMLLLGIALSARVQTSFT